MESFGAVLGFVLRRMRDSWRLQLVIAAGILVAAVLMSSTTIYTRAVSDLSLTVSLREDLTERRQMFTYLNGLPLAGGPNDSARAYAEDSIDERFGELESQQLRFRSTIPTKIDLPLRPGQVIPPTAYFASLDDASSQMEVLQRLTLYGMLGIEQENPLPEFPLDISSGPHFYYLYIGNDP